jgi:hypothetical protein
MGIAPSIVALLHMMGRVGMGLGSVVMIRGLEMRGMKCNREVRGRKELKWC